MRVGYQVDLQTVTVHMIINITGSYIIASPHRDIVKVFMKI
jgi:hypothetical protein